MSDRPTQAPVVDWDQVTEEATGLLRDYIRIDTTNPPGGEEAGALFLRDVLARDGIDSELHDAGDQRVSISARLPANNGGGRKPLCLLSHIDVVPVEREHWRVDPFAAELIDGVIWGRGALDMKGMGIMELMVMLLMKRLGIEPDRDLLYVAVADEEAGGTKGVGFLAETAPHLLEAEDVFNEGAFGFSEFMGKPAKLFGLGPAEKSPCWVRLTTHGSPGHASVPHEDNAVVRLVRALGRIDSRQTELRTTPAVSAMFRTLKQQGFMAEELDTEDPETLGLLASADPYLGAITSDTVNLTGLSAGTKHNVIPATAEATLDCRLLPDTDPDAFIDGLESVIDDPRVEVTRVLHHVSGQSSMDTPAVSVIHEVLDERFGGEASVLPLLSPGFTDSHAYRAAGSQAYGFIPALLTREELATIHGHNERISQENLRLGTEILFEVARRLVCDRNLRG